ncbi:MAG: HYR domain-containing protein [Saprospiraceae bacterium]|nr:HYR domain-containing protein [Saprospiraceae bacterium]
MKRLIQVNPIPKQSVFNFSKKLLTWIYLLICTVQVKAYTTCEPLQDRAQNSICPYTLNMPLSCKGLVQLSLGADGTGILTPSMLLAEIMPSYSQFKVYANHTGSRIITCADAGKTIMATVLDTITGQSCWSSILVEDKLKPIITCESDTLPCTEDPFTYDYSGYALVSDNCDETPTVVYDLRFEKLTCQPRYTGIVHLTWSATDNFGNKSTCSSEIYFKKASLDSVVFPNDTIVYCPNPDLSALHAPTLFGLPIDPFCELLATHSDDSIFICGGMYKINRLWIVMDWCTRTNVMATQQITVADTTRPDITCPANITLSTSSSSCNVSYIIPTPTATDAFSPSGTIQYFVRVDSFFLARPGNTISLSVGIHTMNYIAMDPCGNSDTCLSTITVVDRIAPTMLCLPRLILSLDQNGFACVTAEQILKLGSITDNCGIDTILIRRMTPGCMRPQDTLFRDTICFCCTDLLTTQMVVVKGQDESGNMNFCMMEIVLQNKNTIPSQCPEPITLSCTANFRNLNLTGRIVPGGTGCNDTIRTAFRDSIVIDSCRQGTVTRKFFVYYFDGRIDSSCRQTITIVNNYVFSTTSIIWPNDTMVNNCRSNHPDSIRSRPIVPTDSCGSVYFTFTNSPIMVRSDSCRFIRRFWTAYTTCTPRRTARDTQIIVLNNFMAPLLRAPNDTTIASIIDSCARFVILQSATVSGCNSEVVITNNYTPGGANASGIYPPGLTRVIFTARDGCNNIRRDTTNVLVLDQINPLIQCRLLDTIMPSVDSIKLTARNLLVFYRDNCTPSNRLKISFTLGNFNDTCRVIKCSDLTSPPDTFIFQIFVQDSAGNIGICPATIYVSDPLNHCTTTFQGVGIYGFIKNTKGGIIPNVNVALESHQRITKTDDLTGQYVFAQLNYKDYVSVRPEKNTAWLEGISTQDIIQIQKHILGIQNFANPAEWIAADIDNNGRVTTSDIVLLRKLILGKISKVNENTSWRFISQFQTFKDLENPLESELLESYENDQLNHDLRLDFTGIKIGDLSEQKPKIVSENAESRIRTHDFILENKSTSKGEKIIQDVFIGKNTDFEGFQFGINYTQDELELESITEYITNDLGEEIKSDSYSNRDGYFFTSYSISQLARLSQNQKILRLKWKSKSSKTLDQMMNFKEGLQRFELYSGSGQADQLKLGFKNSTTQNTDILTNWKVMPIPFKYKCYLQCNAIESGVATIDIIDMQGRIVYSVSKVVEKGENIWWIESHQLPNVGTYVYKVRMKSQVIEGKLVLIK